MELKTDNKPSPPQGEALLRQALEALKDALSVCRSVSTCKTRRTREDGVTMYGQTEEWCRWVEDEVGPKVNAAGDALMAALAEQDEEPATARLTAPDTAQR